MDVDIAARMLAAIGHPMRLKIYRALIEAGPDGRAAGDLAQLLEVASSSLSFHLKELTHAGLIHARAQGRYVIYAVVFEAMGDLMLFLARNCCQGNPCLPITIDTGSRCDPGCQSV